MKPSSRNPAAIAWWAFGGLLALGAVTMFVREFPSLCREWKLMRM